MFASSVFCGRKNTRPTLWIVAALCAALLPQAASADLLHDGLVAYWALDEGDGEIAFDTYGDDADNGVLRESPEWMSAGEAILGDSALYFEGFQDVFVTDSMDLEMSTNAVTLSAWFSPDLLPAEMLENYAGIYDSQQDSYVLYFDKGANELRFKVTDDNDTAERPGVPADSLNAEEWHHVMGVYDGANASAKIYFNGDLVDVHTNAGLVDPVAPGQIASIGGNALDEVSGQYYFWGAIDDVAVWNQRLVGARQSISTMAARGMR